MGEREYWQNVYPFEGALCFGPRHQTHDGAVMDCDPDIAFRIHVRLKPEGAPKRYINADNKAAWERDPGTCRSLAASGYAGFFRKGSGFSAGRPPRTPKIEERT